MNPADARSEAERLNTLKTLEDHFREVIQQRAEAERMRDSFARQVVMECREDLRRDYNDEKERAERLTQREGEVRQLLKATHPDRWRARATAPDATESGEPPAMPTVVHEWLSAVSKKEDPELSPDDLAAISGRSSDLWSGKLENLIFWKAVQTEIERTRCNLRKKAFKHTHGFSANSQNLLNLAERRAAKEWDRITNEAARQIVRMEDALERRHEPLPRWMIDNVPESGDFDNTERHLIASKAKTPIRQKYESKDQS